MAASSVRGTWRLLGSAALIVLVAACGNPTPSSSVAVDHSARPSAAITMPQVSQRPFVAKAYPRDADAPCGEAVAPDTTHGPYTGELKRITATDRHTVVFELCEPDVAFLSKIASPSFGIQDSSWLDAMIKPGSSGEQAIVRQVDGTGPFAFESWDQGSNLMLRRNDAYWGQTAIPERLVIRWDASAEHRLGELQGRTVDGIDSVGPDAADAVGSSSELQLLERDGLSTMYVGFNDSFAPFDNVKVRDAVSRGLDREHIVDTFFPAGSSLATNVASCAIPDGCVGKPWPAFDPALAKERLTAAGYADGFKTTIRYSDVPREDLPDPTGVATEIRDQLKANLNIDATLEVVPYDQLVADAEAGKLDGIHLLGVRPRYPDVSSVLDPLFGASGTDEFGSKRDDITTALAKGAATADPAKRTAAYTKANDAISKQVPMIPIAHAGSSVAYRADVLAAQASPMQDERFAAMTPGDRRQLVWMGESEPAGLYCADESDPASLQACAQVSEPLYGYDDGGASVSPLLAESCVPDAAAVTWTCTLRSGVSFHDGATLDATDVVDTFAVQWDAANPRHLGRQGTFKTFVSMFGGFLDPPP